MGSEMCIRDRTGNWYVGINAATLALLTGKLTESAEIAEAVAAACKQILNDRKRDRFWLHATEGEAAILLSEECSDALGFYESALSELTPGKWGMADSAYRQLVRLWRFFGKDGDKRVAPVLELFESSDARDALTRGLLGREWKEED